MGSAPQRAGADHPLSSRAGADHPRSVDVVALLGAAALWATIGLITRDLARSGVRPVEAAWWRALGGGGCFGVEVLWMRRRGDRGGRGVPPSVGEVVEWAAFAFVGVTVFYAALPLAAQLGGITLAWVLLYTAPAFVLLGAPLMLGERVGARGVGLAAVAVLGVVLVAVGGGAGVTVSPASVTWGLVAGASYASYYLVGRRLFERRNPVEVYAVILPLGGLALTPFARPAVPELREGMLLVVLAVGCTWLPYRLLALGLRSVASSRAVVITTVEPVLAGLLAWLFLGERLGVVGAFGGCLVLVSAVYASR